MLERFKRFLERLKRIVAWCLIVLGGLLALISFIPTSSQNKEGATAVLMIGVLMVFMGIVLFFAKGKKATFNPSLPVKSGKPAGYSTKNCPECETRMPLGATICPDCEQTQKKNDSTCSGGVETAAEARSSFAEARRRAKQVGSPGYIWRSAEDGAVCERCANNNGHQFSWDEEPPGGHAGARARCRCYPEPIIPKD
jgi:hypothetical protein